MGRNRRDRTRAGMAIVVGAKDGAHEGGARYQWWVAREWDEKKRSRFNVWFARGETGKKVMKEEAILLRAPSMRQRHWQRQNRPAGPSSLEG